MEKDILKRYGINNTPDVRHVCNKGDLLLKILLFNEPFKINDNEIHSLVFVMNTKTEVVEFIEMYPLIFTDKHINEVQGKFLSNPDLFKNQ
jgi:hypothetical protein